MVTSTKAKFSKSIAWQIEPSENYVYVLNNKNQQWYFLRDISKDIWLQIANNKNIDNIIKCLMEEYKVDYNTLRDDIVVYINELHKEGLVTYND